MPCKCNNAVGAPSQRGVSNQKEMTAQSVPNENWGCGDWIYWHTLLVKQYGKYEANNIWLSQYANQTISSQVRLFCSNTNTGFIRYFNDNGIDLNRIVNTLDATAQTGDSILSGVDKLIKFSPYVIMAFLVFVGVIVYLLVKQKAYEKFV